MFSGIISPLYAQSSDSELEEIYNYVENHVKNQDYIEVYNMGGEDITEEYISVMESLVTQRKYKEIDSQLNELEVSHILYNDPIQTYLTGTTNKQYEIRGIVSKKNYITTGVVNYDYDDIRGWLVRINSVITTSLSISNIGGHVVSENAVKNNSRSMTISVIVALNGETDYRGITVSVGS